MRLRFNPYRLLFPAADAPQANVPPEGVLNQQGDHSASTPPPHTSPSIEAVDALADNASQLSNASSVDDDDDSAFTSSLAAMDNSTLSTTINIRNARLHSLQLPPASRIIDTIGTDIGYIERVATTSDDSTIRRVAFGNADGKLFLFEPITIERDDANSNHDSDSSHSLVVSFQGPAWEITSLVFSSDNTKLLVTWLDDTVMAFDAKDGSKLYECQGPFGLRNCAFSKDGKRIVIGGRDGWKMFYFDNFPSQIEEDECTSPEEEVDVSSVTFSDDDTKLVVGTYNGCYIYNGAGTKVLNALCKGEFVFKVAFSPNEMILAVGCGDKVRLLNVVTGECLHTFQIQGVCSDIRFSKEGHRIFFSTYNGGMINGYDVYSGTLQFEIKCKFGVFGIAALNDKTLLLACGDAHCKVINIAVNPTHQVQHEEYVYDSAVSPNGELIVFTYGWENGFKVYKTSNNELVSDDNSKDTTYSVCYSPCEKKIACVGYNNGYNISIYNVEDWKKERTIETKKNFDWIYFLEGGQHMVGFKRGKSTAYVFNIDKEETAEEPLSITTSSEILHVCVVPQEKNLFAIATKEEIHFHKIIDGQPNKVFTFKFNNDQDGTLQAMQFTSDGSKMVLCSNTHVHTYNFHSDHGVVSSSKLSTLLPIQQDEATRFAVRCMTISRDDKLVAFRDSNDHMYICSLEESGNERNIVHKCPMHIEINTMHFLPGLSSEGRHPLVLSYVGEKVKATTTLEVTAKEGIIDPLLLFRSLDVCKDDAMLNLIPKHKELLYRRDENGRTLAERAVAQ